MLEKNHAESYFPVWMCSMSGWVTMILWKVAPMPPVKCAGIATTRTSRTTSMMASLKYDVVATPRMPDHSTNAMTRTKAMIMLTVLEVWSPVASCTARPSPVICSWR